MKPYSYITAITESLSDSCVNLKTPEMRQKMREFFKMVKVLKPVSKNTYMYYIVTDLGEPEDWVDYDTWESVLAQRDEDTTREELEEDYLADWRDYNPDETRSIKVEAVEQENGDYLVCLNDVEAFRMLAKDEDAGKTMSDKEREKEIYDCRGYIDWLIEGLEIAVDQLRRGIYMENVIENFSYRDRAGTIPRKELWDLCPKVKERDRRHFSAIDMFKLAVVVNSTKADESKEPAGETLGEMTVNIFLDACKVGMDACRKVSGYEYPCIKQLFYNDADKELSRIDPNDPEAFAALMTRNPDWCGTEPSLSVLDMRVVYDEGKGGYYFTVRRSHDDCAAVIFFLAVREAGYPVIYQDLYKSYDKLAGKDTVCFIPTDTRSKQGRKYFPDDTSTVFFPSYNEYEYGAAKEHIDWLPIPEVELAE